jgi:hypothetical protein
MVNAWIRAALAWVGRLPFLLYGLLLFFAGIGLYLFGVLLVFPRYLLGLNSVLLPFNEALVWYSGMPVMAGMALASIDLFVLIPFKRSVEPVRSVPLVNPRVTVALTAYNDEASIGDAVRDFRAHPLVDTVIVVSNDSADQTLARAIEAGAVAFDEKQRGYGACVFRCLTEALRHDETDLIVLCEGDSTFAAFDLDKFIAYAPHADIINGTRTVERLRQYKTQLTTIMYYGNLFMGKMLEAKHLGRSTITDLGTTYKLCHRAPLERLMPVLDPQVNLEFNAHFLDKALEIGCSVVECPITFHPRVGVSKGGNVNDLRALKVGAKMFIGIVFGWRHLVE